MSAPRAGLVQASLLPDLLAVVAMACWPRCSAALLAAGSAHNSPAALNNITRHRAENTVDNTAAGALCSGLRQVGWLLVIVCLVLGVARPAQALLLLETDTKWDGAAPELAVVSVILNGRDLRRDTFVAFAAQNQATYVDIQEFAAALDLELSQEAEQLLLLTPIGEAIVANHSLRDLDGRRMVTLETLGKALASDVTFSQRDFAINVTVPWSLSRVPPQAEVVRPSGSAADTVDAPTVSLSHIRTEHLQRFERGQDTRDIVTDTGGRLFSGYWQVRVRDYLESDPFIEDYTWLQTGRQHRLLLGNQPVSLNPLLGGFDFTGAQAVWTNRGINLFTDSLTAQQLITNQRSSIRSFVGYGPPGGRAELRVDGTAVTSTIIALDGRYEFRDVDLTAGNVVQVEVWVYERGAEGVPTDIQDFSGYNTNQVLPGKTLLVQGGAGVNGNLIEAPDHTLDQAGFVSARYAPLDGLTLESVYQHVAGADTALVGASTSLNRLGFFSAQLALAGGDQAWRLEAENRQRHWFWRGFIQSEPQGWLGRDGEQDDAFGEVGYRFGTQWTLSLVGRDFRGRGESFDYILPALEWRPVDNLLLRARPDFDGDYTAQAYWRVTDRQTLSAIYNEDESSLQWEYNLADRDSLLVQVLDREELGQRFAAIYRRNNGGLRSLGWALGILAGEGSVGYLAQADYEFIPGLRARAEAFRDPYSGIFQRAETVVSLNVIADFNVTSGGISRGTYYRQLLDRGTISGEIKLPEGMDDRYQLAGVAVMLDNQVRTRTEDGGRFTIPYLEPGVYRLRLDLDGLPLELRPRQDAYWVEVAAGAASHVSFATEVLLGFAGQVSNAAGCPLADVRLEVVPAAEAETTPSAGGGSNSLLQTRSNTFGYYRVDGLVPGEYAVRLSPPGTASRTVQLTGDFLFNQDILVDGNDTVCEQEKTP